MSCVFEAFAEWSWDVFDKPSDQVFIWQWVTGPTGPYTSKEVNLLRGCKHRINIIALVPASDSSLRCDWRVRQTVRLSRACQKSQSPGEKLGATQKNHRNHSRKCSHERGKVSCFGKKKSTSSPDKYKINDILISYCLSCTLCSVQMSRF